MNKLATFITTSIIVIITSNNAEANPFRVIKIHDGDTISAVNLENSSFQKIRLACLDSPELSQPQGRLSAATLSAFIPVNSEIEINQVDRDRYGRIVAEVFKNKVNVNHSMLKKGQAIVYHKYLSNCSNSDDYLEAEKFARSNKFGFWNDPSFVNPEAWRQGERIVTSPTKEISSPQTGYISGSCSYLKSLGLSSFTPGDPNYTEQRDGDRDGIACE